MSSYSFVFLPYLKTSGTVRFKGLMFRSTQDTTGVATEVIEHLENLGKMFFLRDHLQIQQMSYAIILRKNDDFDPTILHQLKEFQAIIAYLYSAPHEIFGDPFLNFEHASIYLFTPRPISIYLLEEKHNVESVSDSGYPQPDDKEHVDGYEGIVNFKTHLWVTKGSRIYPPAGHFWLNISQDLDRDLNHGLLRSHNLPLAKFFSTRSEMPHLNKRILTAINWYNRSVAIGIEEEVALVNLAVAFESLLDLEPGEKVTSRFREAVSLLLGGFPRLDSWLTQFYDARSQIIHEGRSLNLRFIATDVLDKKSKELMPTYRSLVSYGRQVFQLCLSTILNGALMADELGLSAMLYTNQQRFERVCMILDKGQGTPEERILAADRDIQDIDTYKFIGETNLKIETLIGAARLVVARYLETNPAADPGLLNLLEDFTKANKEMDHYDALSKLEEIQSSHQLSTVSEKSPDSIAATVCSLLDSVWHYTFQHYYWLVKNRMKSKPENAS